MDTYARVDDTRVVVFKEDYKRKTKGGFKTIYKKDETHYIHKDTVEKLGLSGKIATVTKYDFKAGVDKAKKALKIEE